MEPFPKISQGRVAQLYSAMMCYATRLWTWYFICQYLPSICRILYLINPKQSILLTLIELGSRSKTSLIRRELWHPKGIQKIPTLSKGFWDYRGVSTLCDFLQPLTREVWPNRHSRNPSPFKESLTAQAFGDLDAGLPDVFTDWSIRPPSCRTKMSLIHDFWLHKISVY